jgi:HD-like signal output (HDOD) protein
MLGRWIRSLTTSFPAAPEKASPASRAETAPVITPADAAPLAEREAPAATHATSAAAPREAAKTDIETFLNGEIGWRGRALLSSMPGGAGDSDAKAIVESLISERETLLRQPPQAAQRALSMARSSDSGVAELVALIEHDPGLAQSLLKQANSAFYATGATPCTSLSGGVQRVGMGGVENVLLASMVEGLLCRPGSAYAPMVEKTWGHMVRSAPIARLISPVFGVHPEQAFAIALLHDAGKLVLFDRITTLRTKWRREPKLPPAFLSRALILLHESIGGLAALGWGLGDPAARAIASHHRTHPPSQPDPLSEVIFLAERIDLAEQHGKPLDFERMWQEGALTGDRERVTALFDAPAAEAA